MVCEKRSGQGAFLVGLEVDWACVFLVWMEVDWACAFLCA